MTKRLKKVFNRQDTIKRSAVDLKKIFCRKKTLKWDFYGTEA